MVKHKQTGVVKIAALFASAGLIWLLAKLRIKPPSSSPAKTRAIVQTAQDSKPQQSDEAVAHEKRMRHTYAKMSEEFADKGLDLGAIQSMQPWFHGVEEGGALPWPKHYDQLDDPLPRNAVRLLVVPFEDSPAIVSAAAAVTAEVAGLLPEGTKVFLNARTQYHCTVFHTSYPTDPRPDPYAAHGGLPDLAEPASKRRPPTQRELEREQRGVAECCAASARPVLTLERVVMARSGTLLITWVDHAGTVSQLRSCLHHKFPGACTRQATIIHTTLLRVVHAPEQLPAAAIDDINAACARWTKKLAGRTASPAALWWVHESEFSTITGDRWRLGLGGGAVQE